MSAVPTFAEFAERWLREHYAPFRPRYLERNRQATIKMYLNPSLGPVPLDQITTGMLATTQRQLLGSGLALSTVRSTFGLFGGIWMSAKSEGLVTGRPHSDVVWPRARRKKPTVFTADERDEILRVFIERKPNYVPLVGCVFLAGMRPSEACGLVWDNLDARTGRLEITRAIVAGEETQGKTHKALRQIIASPRLVKLLLDHRPAAANGRALMSRTAEGFPVNTEVFSAQAFRPRLEFLGMPYRPLYAGRHTYITLAIMGGANTAEVATYCGTSVKQVEDSYLSWIGPVADPTRRARSRESASYRRLLEEMLAERRAEAGAPTRTVRTRHLRGELLELADPEAFAALLAAQRPAAPLDPDPIASPAPVALNAWQGARR